MTDFLRRLEQLFHPMDGWGDFRRGARKAAVVFVLYRAEGRWMVPFVRRRTDQRDHPGQVALPGGGVREGEPIYGAVSNFSVVPFVAYLPDPVPPFVHDERELDGVLEIPLDTLLDDAAWGLAEGAWRYLEHDDSVVWGLTERIFAGLAPKLSQALSESASGGQKPDPPAGRE